jgi:hypothetical protein
MSSPQRHPFKATDSDFLTGMAFTGQNGGSELLDAHACVSASAAKALVMHLGSIGVTASLTADFPEPGWPKDAPFTQAAQVPYLEIHLNNGEIIRVNAGEVMKLYQQHSEALADYIVQQRCQRVAGGQG